MNIENGSMQMNALSDDQIIDRLQDATEAEDVFTATREWSLEKMRLSIKSRGDYFERKSAVIFDHDGDHSLRVEVGELPITIGSGEKADCRLDVAGMSRLHCRLERVGNLVRLCDAGSKNGTLLNGKRIDFEDLCDGDEVQFGVLSLRVRRA